MPDALARSSTLPDGVHPIKASRVHDRLFMRGVLLLLVGLAIGTTIGRLSVSSPHPPKQTPSELANVENQGFTEAATGACNAAIHALSYVVSVDPSDVAAEESLGRCYAAVNDFTDAEQQLSIAARSDGTFHGYLYLADALCQAGSYQSCDDALKQAGRRAALTTDKIEVADSASGYGRFKVLASLLNSIPPSDRDFQWYELATHAREAFGNPQQANADAEKAVFLAPPDQRGQAYAELGDAYVSSGACALAVPTYRKAIAFGQDIGQARIRLGIAQCELENGQYAAAIVDASQGEAPSDAAPTLYSLMYVQATAEIATGDISTAQGLLRRIAASTQAPTDNRLQAQTLLASLPNL